MLTNVCVFTDCLLDAAAVAGLRAREDIGSVQLRQVPSTQHEHDHGHLPVMLIEVAGVARVFW
jgi:hypothetical protein